VSKTAKVLYALLILVILSSLVLVGLALFGMYQSNKAADGDELKTLAALTGALLSVFGSLVTGIYTILISDRNLSISLQTLQESKQAEARKKVIEIRAQSIINVAKAADRSQSIYKDAEKHGYRVHEEMIDEVDRIMKEARRNSISLPSEVREEVDSLRVNIIDASSALNQADGDNREREALFGEKWTGIYKKYSALSDRLNQLLTVPELSKIL